MSNYTKATNFATKDSLPTGNAGKIVKGTELDDEFNAIASAISSKADVNSPALVGTPTAPTALSGTNSTQVATTAFVKSAVDTATGSLGTLSTQNSDAVTITGGTISGMTSIADTSGNVRSIPVQNKSTSYTLVVGDSGQTISTTAGVTVPASVFSNGQVITIYNSSASSITITQGVGVTMTLAAVGTTGNRTLQAYGLCTVICLSTNTFVISGAGIY